MNMNNTDAWGVPSFNVSQGPFGGVPVPSLSLRSLMAGGRLQRPPQQAPSVPLGPILSVPSRLPPAPYAPVQASTIAPQISTAVRTSCPRTAAALFAAGIDPRDVATTLQPASDSSPVDSTIRLQLQPSTPAAPSLRSRNISEPVSFHSESGPMPNPPISAPAPLRRSSRLARNEPLQTAQAEAPAPNQGRKRSRRTPAAPKPSAKRRVCKKAPPNLKKETDVVDEKPAADASTCTICMCEPEKEEVASIDGCQHTYCFGCIEKWSERENTCPQCKARFSRIERVHHQKRRKGVKNTKKVKTRDQRSDIPSSAALEGFLASLQNSTSAARINMFGMPLGHGIRGRLVAQTGLAGAGVFGGASLGIEDEDDPVLGLMQVIMRSHREAPSYNVQDELQGFAPQLAGVRVFPQEVSSQYAMPPRSHATNSNDASAGRARDNPLEIDDSEGEDEIQVVRVEQML